MKKTLLLSLFSLSLIGTPVFAKTTVVAPKKVVIAVKKTTVKKVVKKSADVVTGTTIPGAPKGYMAILVKARNQYLSASALAKKHHSAKELAAAEAAYSAALDEANSMLAPVVHTSGAPASATAPAAVPTASSTEAALSTPDQE